MAGVTVISARPGFWRCGRQWTGVTELAPGDLTADEVARLRADPNFTVAETSEAAAERPEDAEFCSAAEADGSGGGTEASPAAARARRKG